MNQRFRRLTDLFATGTTLTLPDGSYLWVQAINAYERDECISDAQVARSRVILALKENGDERIKIEARMAERGRDDIIREIAQARTDGKYNTIVAELETDPDWSEKVAILRRTDFSQGATPPSDEERELLDKILDDWTGAINDRLLQEREWQQKRCSTATDQELLEEYLELWLDKRGSEVASAEYALTEAWYATRYCDAIRSDDGVLDHARCNGHPQRVFDTKADARSAPERLQHLITGALADLAMGDRDPKGSGKPANSSDSPPTPNAAEASTPSTSTETPEQHPGTSSQPSPTPSPS